MTDQPKITPNPIESEPAWRGRMTVGNTPEYRPWSKPCSWIWLAVMLLLWWMMLPHVIADIPDLRHCSAFGATPEEALGEVLRAKEAWLKAAQAARKPIPPPSFRPVIYQVA